MNDDWLFFFVENCVNFAPSSFSNSRSNPSLSCQQVLPISYSCNIIIGIEWKVKDESG